MPSGCGSPARSRKTCTESLDAYAGRLAARHQGGLPHAETEVGRVPDTVTIYSEIPDTDTLGGRLSRARDAAGLSAAQLARRLGVQSSTLQAWESDRSQPRANRLSMLAGMLNVSPSWLLHGVGTAPAGESDAETAEAIGLQLAQLKRLHRETAEIILQIERDIGRLSVFD
jgi:transcriptional regulator with XRE-family HTH domain